MALQNCWRKQTSVVLSRDNLHLPHIPQVDLLQDFILCTLGVRQTAVLQPPNIPCRERMQEAQGGNLQILHSSSVLSSTTQRRTAYYPDSLGKKGVSGAQEPGGRDPGQDGGDPSLAPHHILEVEELQLAEVKKTHLLVCLLFIVPRLLEKLRVTTYLN